MIEPRAITDMGIARIQDVPRVQNQPMTVFRDHDWCLWLTYDGEDMWMLVANQLVVQGALGAQRVFETTFDDVLAALQKRLAPIACSHCGKEHRALAECTPVMC